MAGKGTTPPTEDPKGIDPQVKKLQSDLKSVKAELKTAQEELETAQDELETAQDENREFKKQLRKAKADMAAATEAAEERLNLIQAEVDKLRRTPTGLSTDEVERRIRAAVQAAQDEARRSSEGKDREIERFKQQADEARRNNEAAQAELIELRRRPAGITQDQIDTLRGQLDAAKEQVGELRDQLKDVQRDLRDVQKQHDQALAEIRKTEDRASTAERTVNDQRGIIAGKDAKIASLEEKIANMPQNRGGIKFGW